MDGTVPSIHLFVHSSIRPFVHSMRYQILKPFGSPSTEIETPPRTSVPKPHLPEHDNGGVLAVVAALIPGVRLQGRCPKKGVGAEAGEVGAAGNAVMHGDVEAACPSGFVPVGGGVCEREIPTPCSPRHSPCCPQARLSTTPYPEPTSSAPKSKCGSPQMSSSSSSWRKRLRAGPPHT